MSRDRWQAMFDRLDTLSRLRALTLAESVSLERAMAELERAEPDPTVLGGWPPETETRFLALIDGGMSIRAAARAVGKSSNAGIGRYRRIRARRGRLAA